MNKIQCRSCSEWYRVDCGCSPWEYEYCEPCYDRDFHAEEVKVAWAPGRNK